MLDTLLNIYLLVADICFILAAYIFILIFALLPFMYIFIGYKFDKIFKHKAENDPRRIFEPGIIICNEISRFTVYAGCIVFYKHARKPDGHILFDFDFFTDDFDFRSNANYLQIILSTIYIYGALLVCIMGAIALVPKWIAQGIIWVKNLIITGINYF